MKTFQLRAAQPRDLPAIVGLIAELAEFEDLAHLVRATPESLQPHLFGPDPVVECVVAEGADGADRADGADGDEGSGAAAPRLVGFALFFTNFSTFLARPGLYLEDLYVQPAWRGVGLGKALLSHLGALAVARDFGRFEWSVLDWNQHAIGFYEKMGATVMADWRICRVAGEALARFERPGTDAG